MGGLSAYHTVCIINSLSQLSQLQTFVTMISSKLSFDALPNGKIDLCNLFEFFTIGKVCSEGRGEETTKRGLKVLSCADMCVLL